MKTPAEKVNNFLLTCDKNINRNDLPIVVRDAIKGVKKELIINRTMLGDEQALNWLRVSQQVQVLLKNEYGQDF